MKSFSAYLAESEHSSGTYAALSVSTASQQEIKKFVEQFLEVNDDAVLVKPEDYHCTLIYSRHPCPDVKDMDFDLPVEATPVGFDLFESKSDSTKGSMCLVLKLESKELRALEKTCRDDYGATSDFPTYEPHITLVYGYTGEKPDNNVSKRLNTIKFDGYDVSPLKKDWNSSDDDSEEDRTS